MPGFEARREDARRYLARNCCHRSSCTSLHRCSEGGGVLKQALQEGAGIVYRGGVFGHLLLMLLLLILPLKLLLLHQVRKELREGGEEHGVVLPLLLALLLLLLSRVHGLLLQLPFLPLLLLLPPG